jgi:hypothetical protein
LSVCMWLGNSSCQKTKDKINSLTEFDMSYSSNFTVPATSITVNAPVDFTTSDIATNSANTFASQKTAVDKVTEIQLTKLNLTTNAGNFNYLKSVTVFIQATGLPEVQVASKTTIPDGLTSLDMDMTGTNIKGYITATSFKLRINVTADGAITSDQTITLNQTMHVKASLL